MEPVARQDWAPPQHGYTRRDEQLISHEEEESELATSIQD